jgi:hypothetical protein
MLSCAFTTEPLKVANTLTPSQVVAPVSLKTMVVSQFDMIT